MKSERGVSPQCLRTGPFSGTSLEPTDPEWDAHPGLWFLVLPQHKPCLSYQRVRTEFVLKWVVQLKNKPQPMDFPTQK